MIAHSGQRGLFHARTRSTSPAHQSCSTFTASVSANQAASSRRAAVLSASCHSAWPRWPRGPGAAAAGTVCSSDSRALTKLAVPVQGSTRLSDLAVTGDGTLLILDSSAARVLVLRPGAPVVEPLMRLTTPNPISLAVDESGQRAYVAHGEGIAHLDLQARRSSPLRAGNGIALADFDYIRLHRDSLVGSQVQSDGSRGIVRLQLNGDRRAVSAATLIETFAADADTAMAATVSGDDLYYFAGVAPQVHVKRVKLR